MCRPIKWFCGVACKRVTYAVPKSRNLVPSSSGIMSASSDNMMFVRWEFLITMGTSTNKLSYPILRFLSASGVNSLSLYICIAWGVRRYAFTVRKPRAVFWVSVEINKINWYPTAYIIIYDRWDLESAWKMCTFWFPCFPLQNLLTVPFEQKKGRTRSSVLQFLSVSHCCQLNPIKDHRVYSGSWYKGPVPKNAALGEYVVKVTRMGMAQNLDITMQPDSILL